VYFISVGSYLYSLKPLLLVTLVLAFVPAMLGQIARLHVYWKLEQESAPVRRTYEYYQSTMCDREYYKETRTLGAFEYFYSAFENALRLFCRKQWKTEKKASLIQLSLDVIGFAGMGVSTVILFDATIANEISVGAFAAVFTVLRTMFSMMHQIVCGHIANINQSFGKVNNVIRLLDMPTVGGETKTPNMSEGITMENVSFTYWGRENPAIKNVSLNIGPKETIAIVGENGAGKSTLVRLLTGIYRPTEGRVLIGGLDSARTAPSSLYRGISGVFQKVQKYKMTLKENVILSVPQELTGSSDGTRIKRVLKEAGFNQDDIELETMLSPEYGGIDISGGQWQRLAIARGLYRDHEFIVLDEPTAAIDPVEETKIYLQFQEMAQDKCAIVVTHRLGSARLADRIIVMDKGKIIDMGTHEELLSRPGKYADMYAAQAKWYERNDENITSYGVV
jgi:ATP-binding cassette subfamily B protein